MSTQVLVTDRRYEGKYVAMASFASRKVIASGDNPASVVERAQKKGVTSPVLVFIPKKNVTHIY